MQMSLTHDRLEQCDYPPKIKPSRNLSYRRRDLHPGRTAQQVIGIAHVQRCFDRAVVPLAQFSNGESVVSRTSCP